MAGNITQAGTTAALDLAVSTPIGYFISLKIANNYVAGVAIIGAVGLGGFYLYHKIRSENAIKKALEKTDTSGVVDPKVTNITDGSILVELHCRTETSFLLFLEDFEKKEVKSRLEEEFKKIGFEHELDVTIRNEEEVYEKARQISRERSRAPREGEITEDAAALPAGSMPAGSMPAGSSSAGSIPAGSSPSGSMPAGSSPAGSIPAGSSPAGSMPTGSSPAGSIPAGSIPAGSMPAGSSSAGSSPQVFLSYQWDHQPIVKKLKKLLEDNGISCWMDITEMGRRDPLRTDREIIDGIGNCKVFISCLTKKYLESDFCKREATLAQEREKEIIPLLLEYIHPWPPLGELAVVFKGLVYIYISKKTTASGEILETNLKFKELLERVKEFIKS